MQQLKDDDARIMRKPTEPAAKLHAIALVGLLSLTGACDCNRVRVSGAEALDSASAACVGPAPPSSCTFVLVCSSLVCLLTLRCSLSHVPDTS